MPCKFGSAFWGTNADEVQFDIVLLDLLNNLFAELACQLPAQIESLKPNIDSGNMTYEYGFI